MKIEKLQVGQTVYSVERRGLGNTTLRTTSVFPIRIEEIDLANQRVMASWNHNRPTPYYARSVAKWREKEPVMHTGASGVQRLATKKEIRLAQERAAANLTIIGNKCPIHDIGYYEVRIGDKPFKHCWKCTEEAK